MKKNKFTLTPEAVSRYLPQFFVGLFFLTAGYIKWYEGLFGSYSSDLSIILTYWMDQKMMAEFYRPFATLMLPYADAFAASVVVFQCLAGFLLIINRGTRLAGFLLFFTQLNVYFATYHQLELRVLNSQAMLLGLYYFARPDMKGKVWSLFTYGLVVVGLMHLAGRAINFKDYSTESFGWQREVFAGYSMSSWPGLKYFVLWLSSGESAPVMWASFWWVKVGLVLGMLTRYRFYAGLGWLLLALVLTLVWLSTWSCEGVMWVLIMFVWVTHERTLQMSQKNPPVSLLP